MTGRNSLCTGSAVKQQPGGGGGRCALGDVTNSAFQHRFCGAQADFENVELQRRLEMVCGAAAISIPYTYITYNHVHTHTHTHFATVTERQTIEINRKQKQFINFLFYFFFNSEAFDKWSCV